SLRVVVAARHQFAAAHITGILNLWPMEDEVVINAAAAAQTASHHSLFYDVIRYVNHDHGVNVVRLQEKHPLTPLARQAVKDESVVPVVQIEPCFDSFRDNFVRHQHPCVHDSLNLSGKLGVVLDVPSKNVTDRDVDQVVSLRQAAGLGAFAGAVGSHDDKLIHDVASIQRI